MKLYKLLLQNNLRIFFFLLATFFIFKLSSVNAQCDFLNHVEGCQCPVPNIQTGGCLEEPVYRVGPYPPVEIIIENRTGFY